MEKLLTSVFLCDTMSTNKSKGETEMIIAIIVLGAILVVENAVVIPLMVIRAIRHKKTKEELHSNKQSKEFHIKQLQNRYKGVENDYDGKRSSRKM